MIPVLTIPETAYEPSRFLTRNKKSRIAAYIFQLTRGSAAALTIAYILAFFAIKPLLETTAERRLEVLEHFRHKLRDCYLSIIGRVSRIPIVAINKNGKVYADAIVQTELNSDAKAQEDKLKQGELVLRLEVLSNRLKEATPYLKAEIPHYGVSNFALKELQNKVDLVFFGDGTPFCYREVEKNGVKRKVNVATEARDEVRTIKGLFMSGQA